VALERSSGLIRRARSATSAAEISVALTIHSEVEELARRNPLPSSQMTVKSVLKGGQKVQREYIAN
jgi:uncharacterized membrane protein